MSMNPYFLSAFMNELDWEANVDTGEALPRHGTEESAIQEARRLVDSGRYYAVDIWNRDTAEHVAAIAPPGLQFKKTFREKPTWKPPSGRPPVSEEEMERIRQRNRARAEAQEKCNLNAAYDAWKKEHSTLPRKFVDEPETRRLWVKGFEDAKNNHEADHHHVGTTYDDGYAWYMDHCARLSGQQLPIDRFTKIARDFLDPLSKLYAGGMDEEAGKVLLSVVDSYGGVEGAVYRMLFETLAKVYGARRIEASIRAASPGLSGQAKPFGKYSEFIARELRTQTDIQASKLFGRLPQVVDGVRMEREDYYLTLDSMEELRFIKVLVSQGPLFHEFKEVEVSPRLNGDISFTVFQNEKHPLTVSAKISNIEDALQDMGYPMDTPPEIIDRNLSEESEHFLHKLEEHSGLEKIVVTALPDNPYVESNPEWWETRNGERLLKESSYTEYLGKVTLGKVVGLGERIGVSAIEITFNLTPEEEKVVRKGIEWGIGGRWKDWDDMMEDIRTWSGGTMGIGGFWGVPFHRLIPWLELEEELRRHREQILTPKSARNTTAPADRSDLEGEWVYLIGGAIDGHGANILMDAGDIIITVPFKSHAEANLVYNALLQGKKYGP